ncbi:type IV toxin-antitoxin system AbiEi family antitoxin domain-containing protein [Agromyces bauzanensis]|uniref:Transcriptional regulator n=1 Tax=Agromyces bauzanensis TaxID=1308924 RepID=A0A917UN66_9MICO|nr:hypothetical protein [Agromyces bauzanensis]GGJ69749.1 transcriptional regulator [Agromyces bauzanensis]
MDAPTFPDLVRYRDLETIGLTRYRFDRLIEAEQYERIAPGLFLRAGTVDDTTAAWMAIAYKKPEATICLLSALALHDLTDEIPSRTDIAIPRGSQPLVIHHTPIAWHRFDADTFTIGRTEHALPNGLSIGLYSAERTIIDLFRLRHEWGSDLAIGALKRWLRERGNSPAALSVLADDFPKARAALQNASSRSVSGPSPYSGTR